MFAAAFWWRDQPEGAFVAASLGVLAWFVNLRVEMRATLPPEDGPADDEPIREDQE